MWASRVVAVSVCALAACGEVVTEPDHADVTIRPSSPKTADDLVASTDVDSVTLQWSKNGAANVTGAQVSSSLTAKGETWAVDVVSSGGDVIGHAEVVIGNTAPSMFEIDVELTGTGNTPVPCTMVAAATDDDGDAVTYSASWLRNGVAYTSAMMTMFAGDTVPAIDHAATDQFECTVIASDGTDMQTAQAGARWYLANGASPNGTMQTFTTPNVASVVLEVGGAEGGGGGAAGATNGAKLVGTFAPSAGTQLQILVGQKPSGSLAGGGGTFVMAPNNTPLIIAGGGGSVTGGILPAESMGRAETSGGTAGTTVRADSGQGGRIVAGANSGGGGGLMAAGQGSGGGKGFGTGGAGGGVIEENQWGGFGGGGGRGGLWGQGGGGGYSGGSCGDTYTAPVPPATTGTGTWAGCGGGGSLNTGMLQTNTAGAVTGNGYVKITW